MNKKALAALALAALVAYQSTKGQASYSADTEAALKADADAKKIAADAEEAKAGEITSEELATIVTKAVKEQIDARLPDHLKGLLTADAVKTIVTEAVAREKAKPETLTADSIKTMVAECVTKAVDSAKLPSHYQGERSEAKGGADIELPVSWRKGNLPLHGKQLLNVMLKKNVNEGITAAQLEKGIALGENTVDTYRQTAQKMANRVPGVKALTSTGAGTGDELVPRDLSSELQRRFYLASNLSAVMAGREIEMPSQPYDYPLATTRPTFYLETTENATATESSPGTAALVLDAKRMMGRTDFSYEVEEDSIIPVLSFVQESLASAAADKWESALVNGDDTATHQDSDTQAIAKAGERAFKGFRKLANAVAAIKVDLVSGGISEANLRAMRKKMGKYGLDPRKLIWLVGAMGDNDIQGVANVATVDKFGPRATILTGEVAALFGIPIITSAAVREDLNASGVYDGTTTTKGSILLVRTDHFLTGRRRQFTVEVDKDIKTQTQFVVATFRKAFTPMEVPSASIPTVVFGYNYNA